MSVMNRHLKELVLLNIGFHEFVRVIVTSKCLIIARVTYIA